MVSSAPASSEPRPPDKLGQATRPIPGAEYPSALVRFLTVPAAFFASNWAAMLLIIIVVGIVPALVATTRTTGNLSEYADRAFRETLRAGARLLRRDGIVSVVLWGLVALLAGNVLVLTRLAEGGTRVFLVGLALPPTWIVVSMVSAYVVAAAALPLDTERRTVARATMALVMRRPLRALLAPGVIVALTPLWLLAPLTIAIGFSLPPHFLSRVWGRVDPVPGDGAGPLTDRCAVGVLEVP